MRFNELDSTFPHQLDFMPREQRNDTLRTFVVFFAVVVLILLSAYSPLLRGLPMYAPAAAAAIVALLGLHTIYRKQKNLDLVMSTEYQNLIFTQALGIGCSFVLIVQRDGTIHYANDGLSKVFPRFHYSDAKALEGLFEQGTVRMADRERIMGAIRSGSSDHLIFPIYAQGSDKKDYIITVEPLVRPGGFSLIRGREYLGQRTGAQVMPDILRSTSVDKLDRLLSTTPTAHYTTDAFGRFEYVNPAFETLFGYGAGEILEGKLSIHHLLFSFGSQVVTEEYSLADYNGPATIVNKHGTRTAQTVVQYALRDATGKAIGATGSLF